MRLGLIGCGNMGTAILAAVINKKFLTCNEVSIFETDIARSIHAVERYGVRVCSSYQDLAQYSDVIILAVKPQVMEKMLEGAKEHLIGKGVVSIAAGWPSSRYEKILCPGTRFLRVMPNTPAMYTFGMTAICTNTTLLPDELEFVKKIFRTCGSFIELDEKYFDIVTALSGSGPAFMLLMVEAFIAAGIRDGLTEAQARELTVQTLLGTAAMLRTDDIDPAIQRMRVSSPAGTTIEGLYTLEEEGVRAAYMKAIHRAYERSKELSGELK